MFWKKSQGEIVSEIKLSHLAEEVADLRKRLNDLFHEVQKQDGYIRSLRGLVNRMRGMEIPKEEDIKSSDPTDFLKKL